MEVFKILKFDSPISLRELFSLSLRDHKLSLILPLVSTNKSRQNYVFKSASVWNELLPNILEKSKAGLNGIVIPGSVINSDLAASISNIKSRASNFLISKQKMGNLLTWWQWWIHLLKIGLTVWAARATSPNLSIVSMPTLRHQLTFIFCLNLTFDNAVSGTAVFVVLSS